MGRKKQKVKLVGDPAWLVTFSDLVTLLLTFFVLILSMSSMDRSVLTKINTFPNELGMATKRGAGRVPTRIRMLIELLEKPDDVLLKQDRIKDLLFPDDILPQEISRSTLDENLSILERPEGVALVLNDKLLFAPDSSKLTPAAIKILMAVSDVLSATIANVNISGYTDNGEGSQVNPYALSADRALSVLDYFLKTGFKAIRFSASGYGPNEPVASNETAEGRAQNRRIEIYLKTKPFFAGYQQ